MLAELPEGEAGGQIAEIYGEIRRLWAVPYVSSLQRHLATKPGWLEWTWDALGPAFLSGQAQTVAWRIANALDLPTLSSMPAATLHRLGVGAAGQRTVREVCTGFVRVAPVNLIFAGLLRRLLNGERPAGAAMLGETWRPPAPVAAPPAMIDVAALGRDAQAILLMLGTDVDGTPFVPGLYRILAHWPAYIAHLGEVLGPLATAPETNAARAALLAGIDRSVTDLFPQLPARPDLAMPPSADIPAILAALDTYRRTSPEMVIFGRLIASALPDKR